MFLRKVVGEHRLFFMLVRQFFMYIYILTFNFLNIIYANFYTSGRWIFDGENVKNI